MPEDTVEGFKELEIEEVKKLGGGDSYLKCKKRCPGFSSQVYQLSNHLADLPEELTLVPSTLTG